MMSNATVTRLASAAFAALADPTRRAVLDLLRRGCQPAGRIADAFPVSRPAISRHLGVLRRSRLVIEQRQGRHRVYHLNAQPLAAVDSWLEQYRCFWHTQLSGLKAFVESESQARPRSRRSSKTHSGKENPR
jgi:DNA-binding transcriptional ArsR family regulator